MGIYWGLSGACGIDSLNPVEADAFLVFWNNFLVGVSMVFLGWTTGGIYGCIVLLVNGYLVGDLLQYLLAENRYSDIMSGLLPHVGIEVVGLICFAVVGFVPMRELIVWMKKGTLSMPVKYIFRNVGVLFLLGTMSLAVAAVIEGNVSAVV